MMKSCTAPAKTAPITSQRKPGKNPNCAASTGPSRRPRSRNRSEVMAEQDDLIRGMEIDAVIQPHRRGHALIIQLNNSSREPASIKAIGQYINTSRRHNQPEAIDFFMWIDETDDKGERDSTKDGEESPKHRINTDMRGILTHQS